MLPIIEFGTPKVKKKKIIRGEKKKKGREGDGRLAGRGRKKFASALTYSISAVRRLI